ncbi:hypothetical protein ACFQZT_17050 [Paenibacillus sp. GCM10027628]|uniref:hypothetical protein n=1 Tax=Paenibacillus sp. GCM10027628 TaxID=3273413 RepID=UPI003628D99E
MNSIKWNDISRPGTNRPQSSSLRWWKRWPEWVRQAAIVWTLLYGMLGLYWSIGGSGFPLGPGFHIGPVDDQHAASTIYSDATVKVAAPIVTILCLAGVLVLIKCKSKSQGFARKVLLLYAWSAASILCFLVPDARALIAVAYAPICLIGALLGRSFPYWEFITWPVVNQFICLAGGLLWAATALSFQRQSRDACGYCGSKSEAGRWIDSDFAVRWGKRATYVAIFAPVYYDITRIAWLLGIPLGITKELFQSLQDSGAVWAGAGLALVSISGAALTHGLIRPWGEIVPRWIPLLAGKRIPPTLAVVPAALVSIMLTVTGIQVVKQSFSSDILSNWGAGTPLLLWPIWGIALGIATISYYYRRQGRCNHCGL